MIQTLNNLTFKAGDELSAASLTAIVAKLNETINGLNNLDTMFTNYVGSDPITPVDLTLHGSVSINGGFTYSATSGGVFDYLDTNWAIDLSATGRLYNGNGTIDPSQYSTYLGEDYTFNAAVTNATGDYGIVAELRGNSLILFNVPTVYQILDTESRKQVMDKYVGTYQGEQGSISYRAYDPNKSMYLKKGVIVEASLTYGKKNEDPTVVTSRRGFDVLVRKDDLLGIAYGKISGVSWDDFMQNPQQYITQNISNFTKRFLVYGLTNQVVINSVSLEESDIFVVLRCDNAEATMGTYSQNMYGLTGGNHYDQWSIIPFDTNGVPSGFIKNNEIPNWCAMDGGGTYHVPTAAESADGKNHQYNERITIPYEKETMYPDGTPYGIHGGDNYYMDAFQGYQGDLQIKLYN